MASPRRYAKRKQKNIIERLRRRPDSLAGAAWRFVAKHGAFAGAYRFRFLVAVLAEEERVILEGSNGKA